MESRKRKSLRKNQKLGTIVQLPARMDAILKKIVLTLQAASAYTHFRGGVMGSNADFMEKVLKPEEYAYPSNSSKIKNRHETFINPTQMPAHTPRGCGFLVFFGLTLLVCFLFLSFSATSELR